MVSAPHGTPEAETADPIVTQLSHRLHGGDVAVILKDLKMICYHYEGDLIVSIVGTLESSTLNVAPLDLDTQCAEEIQIQEEVRCLRGNESCLRIFLKASMPDEPAALQVVLEDHQHDDLVAELTRRMHLGAASEASLDGVELVFTGHLSVVPRISYGFLIAKAYVEQVLILER